MEEQNQQQNQQQPQSAPAPQADPSDAQNNKGVAILAYIIFFIPLLAAKDSKFAMYHANQGLVLFLGAVALNLVGGMIPFIGWFLILPIGNLLILVLAIMGIMHAAKGEMKPLPIIGGINILK